MKWGKVAIVIVGALIVTALGIDAADTISGNGGTLLSQVIRSEGGCGQGMVPIDALPGVTCVDAFEVSPGPGCPIKSPSSMVETIKNAETKECTGVSEEGRIPWSYVTRDQALSLCARSGKRLPSNEEWYGLVLGMVEVERGCNIDSRKVSATGAYQECVAPHGASDLIGNVWEWTSDDVVNGMYKNRSLPESGYVSQVDNAGVAMLTEKEHSQELYGKDYFWSDAEGLFGIVRGGYYDSGIDAGLYTVHADTAPNTASIGIGFRCVQ